MSEMVVEVFRPERILVSGSEMSRVDRFIAYDEGLRTGSHGRRKTASPEFMITIVNENETGNTDEEDYIATIVASDVPLKDSTAVASGAPLAIAEIEINDQSWYMLISRGIGYDVALYASEVLVQHQGEPEDLLARPKLFEPADD